MFRFRVKRSKKTLPELKDVRKPPAVRAGQQASPPAKSQFEAFLDDRTRRRSQKWCRACLSDVCSLENRLEHNGSDKPASADDDEEFHNKLECIREKRMDVEKSLEHHKQLISVIRLDSLRKPYLPSQHHLPPWLMGVVEQELSLPLVPTFPTSAEELTKLASDLDLDYCDDTLRHDYSEAGACVHRVRVGVSYEDCPISLCPSTCLTSPPTLYVSEEISDGELQVSSPEIKENVTSNEHISPEELNKSRSSVDAVGDLKIALSKPHSDCEATACSFLQELEKKLVWRRLSVCSKARVTESRDERVLITGLLQTAEKDAFPFKLLLFPGERTGAASMRMTGTFIRKAERSRYNLRWKYDVRIPSTLPITSTILPK